MITDLFLGHILSQDQQQQDVLIYKGKYCAACYVSDILYSIQYE